MLSSSDQKPSSISSLSSTAGLVNSPATLFGIKTSEQEQKSEKKPDKAELIQIGCDLGCNEFVIRTVIDADKITDYTILHAAIKRICRLDRDYLVPWQLFAMSGDTAAMNHALTLKDSLEDPIKPEDMFFFTLLSGSLEAIEYAEKLLPRHTQDYYQEMEYRSAFFPGNILRFAARSGSMPVMSYVLTVLKVDPKKDSHLETWSGQPCDTLIEYAAQSGSLEMLKYVVEGLNYPSNALDVNSSNMLHLAAKSGSVEVMHHAHHYFKIDPIIIDHTGRNALHWAACVGSIEGMRYAIVTLKLDPTQLDARKDSILFLAVKSSSPEAVRFVMQLNADWKLGLDSNAKNMFNHSVYHWLNRQDSPASMVIREILKEKFKPSRVPIIPLPQSKSADDELRSSDFMVKDDKHLETKVILHPTTQMIFKKPKIEDSWRAGLYELGCRYDVLDAVIEMNIIKDYRLLYRATSQLLRDARQKLEIWHLLAMSGEPDAIKQALTLTDGTWWAGPDAVCCFVLLTGSMKAVIYMEQNFHIGSYARIQCRGNLFTFDSAIAFAIRSGSVEIFEHVLAYVKKLDIRAYNQDKFLFFAAESGSADMMRIVRKHFPSTAVYKYSPVDNVLFRAAESGSVAAMRCAVKEFKVVVDDIIENECACLAALSGSVEALTYVVHELGVKPPPSILFYAARSGSVPLIKHAIGELKLEPKGINDALGYHLLHYAMRSGSRNTVKVVRQLNDDLSLNFIFKSVTREVRGESFEPDVRYFKALSEDAAKKVLFSAVDELKLLHFQKWVQEGNVENQNLKYIKFTNLKKFFKGCLLREEKDRLVVERNIVFSLKDLTQLCSDLKFILRSAIGDEWYRCDVTFSMFRDCIHIYGVSKEKFQEIFSDVQFARQFQSNCPVL